MQKRTIFYKTQLLFDMDKRKSSVSEGVYWICGVKSTLIAYLIFLISTFAKYQIDINAVMIKTSSATFNI